MTAAVVVILGVLTARTATQPFAATSPTPLAELAEQYRKGDRDDALGALALWSRGEVESESLLLLQSLDAAARGGRATGEDVAQRRTVLSAAAALLSEAAWRSIARHDPARARWQLQAAAPLARRAASATGPDSFHRCFHLAAGLMLHLMGDLAAADEMLSQGRRGAENDAELLLALGSVHEIAASLRTYEPAHEPGRPPRAGEEPRFVIEGEEGVEGKLPSTDLADAQAAFTRALRLDPELLEARLRLARVLVLRGRPREALAELERVARASPSPAQCHMARLFEGRARERLGDLDGAARAFSAAVDGGPRSQSALLALGRELDRLGEQARAQAAFAEAMQPSAETDPWWDYVKGQPGRVPPLVEELRRLAW